MTGAGRRSPAATRRRAPAPPPPRTSGRALRAAAQREATLARARDARGSLLERLGGPISAEPARWRPVAALVLCLGGLGVSIYLTIQHFGHFKLACASSGIINCEAVTTSAQSHFLGMPVAVLGLAFFVVMTVLNLPPMWRAEDRRVHLVRLAAGIVGMCFVLYLVAAELVIIRNICLWCTSVHVLTFALFVLLLATIPPMVGWFGTAATD